LDCSKESKDIGSQVAEQSLHVVQSFSTLAVLD
jgi:hypothetical protein